MCFLSFLSLLYFSILSVQKITKALWIYWELGISITEYTRYKKNNIQIILIFDYFALLKRILCTGNKTEWTREYQTNVFSPVYMRDYKKTEILLLKTTNLVSLFSWEIVGSYRPEIKSMFRSSFTMASWLGILLWNGL